MKYTNFVNCYIDGRKAAIAIVESVIYLMSHSSSWAGAKLDNMLGWKFARRICAVGPVANCKDMQPGYIKEILFDFCSIAAAAVILEGTPEFDAIRENIRRCPGRTRKGSPRVQEELKQEEPKQEPAPIPAPVPVPAPKKDILHHENFEKILGLLSVGRYVYLHGPAGSGKNVIAEQCADALGLTFYYTNTVFDKSELVGYRDAMGRYQDTQFYRAYKNGGLFMLDEADVSIPEALTTVNGALAGDYYDFCGEMVRRHPDFHCIAAGNTNGQGATAEYNTRAQIDESTRNRFEFVPVDYCRAIEKAAAGGDADILDFMRDLRNSARRANISIITGYRCMTALAKVKQIAAISISEALEYCVFKGMDKDDRKVLFSGLKNQSNPYAVAMCY